MVNKAYIKNIFRTIGKSKGRYFAIMAIIALGVGFFSGIKVTKSAMIESANTFYEDNNFYDFKVLSTYGFTGEEISEIQSQDYVLSAEGGYSVDFLFVDKDESEAVLKAISMPKNINLIELKEGRMPQSDSECVIDASQLDTTQFGSEVIGTKITIADTNGDDVKSSFEYKEYTVVGLVYSPLYLSYERGTTTLGNGKLNGFVYIPEAGFDFEYYTEMYIDCQDEYYIYDEKYEDYIESLTAVVEEDALENVESRYEEMLESIDLQREEAIFQITGEVNEQVREAFYSELYASGLDDETIQAMLESGAIVYPQDEADEMIAKLISEIEFPELEEPEIFVLDRNTNTGYVCYDNDTNIVDGLAKVFPVFFFLIAALVCSTTMTRMIDDERGQIGTLRALGYTNTAIIWKYMVYSGSAAIIGCVIGFFGGCFAFPFAIGEAYTMLYDFGRSVEFYFEPLLLIITILVSFLRFIWYNVVTSINLPCVDY